MNTITHPVAPEELMALVDGELTATEAEDMNRHLEQCSECAKIAAEFRILSQSLAQWTVPAVSSALDVPVSAAAKAAASRENDSGCASLHRTVPGWSLWALGGALAMSLVLIAVRPSARNPEHALHSEVAQGQMVENAAPAKGEMKNSLMAPTVGFGGGAGGQSFAQIERNAPSPAPGFVGRQGRGMPTFRANIPMVARTVSLEIAVKNFDDSRKALDAILALRRGYAAQLTANTGSDPRSLQASLRIPTEELPEAMIELRAMGHVETESQSGEEVSQQRVDLAARLTNARETEDRMRAILHERAGSVSEVLEVEEEISNVREQIERMEAEQQNLDNRIDFATIDLKITEQGDGHAASKVVPVSTRIRNAFAAGLRNASDTALGIVLFLMEFGAAILIWLVILGVPAFLLWRRYRRIHAQMGS